MAKSLRERGAAALRPTGTLVDSRSCLEEVRAALPILRAKQAAAEERLTDPMADQAAIGQANLDADEARIEGMRMARLEVELAAKIKHVEDEIAAKQRGDFAAAVEARRDALAAELKSVGPRLLADVVGFIKRIEASDAEIKGANLRLDSAEAIARNCPGNFYLNSLPVRRLKSLVVPRFDVGDRVLTLWPDQAAEMDHQIQVHEQEQKRLAAVRRAERKREASRRWYVVQRPESEHGKGVKPFRHAGGTFSLGDQRWACELYADQAAAAQSSGMLVEPIGTEDCPWQRYQIWAEDGSRRVVHALNGECQVGSAPRILVMTQEQAKDARRYSNLTIEGLPDGQSVTEEAEA